MKKNNISSKFLRTAKKYQLDYAAGRSQMYDVESRKDKARKIVKLLELAVGKDKVSKMRVLDIGGSTGIIDCILSESFKKIIGIDIDKQAIDYANKKFKRKNLKFEVGDALNLHYKDDSFDLVICTHVYEHVADQEKLFKEIHRVLKKNGLCYLAATNRLWILEPHYNLPFLSWLPKRLANLYMKTTGKGDQYYESPLTYWGLRRLTSRFRIIELTDKIIRNLETYGYNTNIFRKAPLRYIIFLLSPLAKYLSPTFIWILVKE